MAKTLLEAKQLSKSFGARKVIRSLSLGVMRGDVYGFLGQNGQGKTTTIRLITCLIFPDAGEVIINGHSLRTDFKRAGSNFPDALAGSAYAAAHGAPIILADGGLPDQVMN